MNIKALIEKRNTLLVHCDELLNRVGAETRAMTAEERADYDAAKQEIDGLTATITAMQESEKRAQNTTPTAVPSAETDEQREYRAFDSFLRCGEVRADNNMQTSENGAIIPHTIANKIIETVKELSPIYSKVTKVRAKGTLSFPVWGKDGNDDITCAYATEYTEPDTHAGKFTSVELTGYLFSAQVKIPKSLINNAQFDVVSFVIRKVSEVIAEFYERELINGTAGKITGAVSAETGVTTAGAAAITSDELIDLQASIVEPYQAKSEWLMNKKTLTAIRKLKDANGQYMLNRDITRGFGWELLGRPVMISDNMPEMAAGKTAVIYGDFSGIVLKTAENPSIQVLNELYAKQHAVGISVFGESDAKIIEPQKLRKLVMKGS
ncbi:MAG: phage major capsid protein [Clostridiales bacterium]|nr:phage major capsid protein [Clostridiales bacterium]